VAIELPENVVVSKLDELASWCRKNSLWPMPFATACCGIELMATAASRYDIARFGSEAMRFSPRQCDLMLVAGRVVNPIHVDPEVARHARVALDRMLALPGETHKD